MVRKVSKAGRKHLSAYKSKVRPSKQPTNNNQHAEEEDEADLSGEDLDFLKEYGESIGFLTKIKAEDLTKKVENAPAPAQPAYKKSASYSDSEEDSEMEDYDEVASQDEWESVDGEEEEEDAGEFNEVDDDNIAETSYNPRVKKRKVDEDECEESYEMNPRKKKEWDQQAESDAASSASRLPVFDDGILKSNKTPLVVDRDDADKEKYQELRRAKMLKRDAKRFDTNKKTDATKKRKSASSSSSEEEHDDEEEDEYDYGDAPYRDSTPGSSPSFDPSKKLDTFVSKAERMAEIASLLTENPEKNIALLKNLRDFSSDKSAKVRKLSFLTQLAVYKDIIPGYRIRQLSDAEKAVKVSKEVNIMRQYEDTLLSNYQAYLQLIDRVIDGLVKLKAGDRDDSILLVAMRCLTDLLTCATHFNFRINILMAVVNRMTIRHPPQVSALCCNAIKALFEKDESGEASLEAVKLISKLIKSKNFNVQDQILRTFLHLKLSSNIHARQNEEADQAHRKKSLSKKKSQQPHISKNIKKVMKEVKEIQEEMKEAEAVVSKEEKERLHTEILKFVFITYFRILKNAPSSPLLPAVLAGLSRFAHLINVDFFEDLLALLKNISKSQMADFYENGDTRASSDALSTFHCINASFQILTGQGEALNIDLKDFYTILYAQLMRLPLLPSHQHISTTSSRYNQTAVELGLQGVNLMFMKRKEMSVDRVAAFVKRLITISLQLPSNATLSCLIMAQKLISKYPKVANMLDTAEMSGTGVFRADLQDPELCNPFATSLWELSSLTNHYNSNVRTIANSIASLIFDKAGQILQKLLSPANKDKGYTIKSLVLAEDVKEKKRVYGLVCESLKYKQVIEQILEVSGMLKIEKKLNAFVAHALVYDLLFGKGLEKNAAGKYKDVVNRHRARLNAELVKIKIKRRISKNEDLIPKTIREQVVLPRYARVNLLKSTVDQVIKAFVKEGFRLGEPLTDLSSIPPKTIRKDLHLSDLVVFPSGTDLHAHPLLLNGTIILQDKASCFPAHILNPPRGAHIIDACAAPGNKTSHLASLIGNQGSIFAFDQDAKRLGTLQMLSRRAGCSSIEAIHQDFLKVNPNDAKYKNVEYILLDPSCSGSGIVSRLDHLVEEHEQQQQQQKQQQKQQKSRDSLNPSPVETSPETLQNQRLESLADFQYNAIIHAFKFPSIKRVVYSTCSRHEIENEGVVQKVLKKLGNVRLIDRDQVLPTWPRRGINGETQLLRALPEEDFTIGFFVALFEKNNA